MNTRRLWETDDFQNKILEASDSSEKIQWFVGHYYPAEYLKVFQGVESVSHYALLRKSKKFKNFSTQTSLDTAIFIGDHYPQNRTEEYYSFLPDMGRIYFLQVLWSENSKIKEISAFQRCTQGSIRLINLVSESSS